MNENKIGKRIRFYRRNKDLTQKELAIKTNLSICTISEIENGHQDPKYITLCNLAEALEIDRKELF